LILAVNAPAIKQSHREPNFEVVDTASRNLPEFLDRIVDDLALSKPVTVADVAYANGAESRFVTMLLNRTDVSKLAGFAAWNTAGNTLGSAIASGVIALHAQDTVLQAEAVFARLVDDWLYQTKVRSEVRVKLENPSPFELGDLKPIAEAEITARMTPLVQALFDQHFAPHLPGIRLEWGQPSLAWSRLFTGVFPLAFDRDY
jgi:hypothetical protein